MVKIEVFDSVWDAIEDDPLPLALWSVAPA